MKFFIQLPLLCFLIIFSSSSSAQNQGSKWFFGSNAGLDFMTSSPTILTNGMLNTVEGCASMADAAGNLLFYTDGSTVYDKNHNVMSNGTGLLGNSSTTQSGVIIKQPGNSNIYVIFTLGSGGSSTLNYSFVDMNLAAGIGSVTTKNILLASNMTEKLTSVNHCNGSDVWAIAHEALSNNFKTFLVTSTGVNAIPVVSSTGTVDSGGLGNLKSSPNGKKLGSALWGNGMFEVYDFDNTTGIVSNAISLGTTFPYAYGCEFSPDGSKFYGGMELSMLIYQWDLCSGPAAAIIASQNTVGVATGAQEVGAFQLAINGKIYISRYSTPTLATIDNPNAYGMSCNFVNLSQSIAPRSCQLGLPNFITSTFKTPPPPFTYTASCSGVVFDSQPVTNTLNAGCGSVTSSVSSVLWSFGDPASGASNSSTLSSPTHVYPSTGNYTATMILFGICTSDTVRLPIVVPNNAPSLTVTGTFTMCSGDKSIFTASGANTYSWNTTATSNSVALSPQGTTIYNVVGTFSNNSCKANKTFTVTVNKCTGIEQIDNDNNLIEIYPNPNSGNFSLETNADTKVIIYDMRGVAVYETKLAIGNHSLDLRNLSNGVYVAKCIYGNNVKNLKFIKQD